MDLELDCFVKLFFKLSICRNHIDKHSRIMESYFRFSTYCLNCVSLIHIVLSNLFVMGNIRFAEIHVILLLSSFVDHIR